MQHGPRNTTCSIIPGAPDAEFVRVTGLQVSDHQQKKRIRCRSRCGVVKRSAVFNVHIALAPPESISPWSPAEHALRRLLVPVREPPLQETGANRRTARRHRWCQQRPAVRGSAESPPRLLWYRNRATCCRDVGCRRLSKPQGQSSPNRRKTSHFSSNKASLCYR